MTESADAPTRELFGLDADLLTAFGALAVPLIVLLLGIWVFRYQQQSQHAGDRFLGGLQKLYGTLSTLLSIHLQNYQIGSYIIRTMRTYERGHPLAPEPDEIPEFMGLQLESLPIDSLLPVQELIGDKVILDWVMLALSDVTLEAKECEFQIRQPTAAYYRKTPSKNFTVDMNTSVRMLTEKLDLWEKRSSKHFALLDRLNDLESHLGRKRPWTVGGYYSVQKRSEVKEILSAMKVGYAEARKAHDETEAQLRGNGQEGNHPSE